MANYIVLYSRFNNELNVPENASRDVLLQAYLTSCGGANAAINHFFKYIDIVPDFTEEAQLIETEPTKIAE